MSGPRIYYFFCNQTILWQDGEMSTWRLLLKVLATAFFALPLLDSRATWKTWRRQPFLSKWGQNNFFPNFSCIVHQKQQQQQWYIDMIWLKRQHCCTTTSHHATTYTSHPRRLIYRSLGDFLSLFLVCFVVLFFRKKNLCHSNPCSRRRVLGVLFWLVFMTF